MPKPDTLTYKLWTWESKALSLEVESRLDRGADAGCLCLKCHLVRKWLDASDDDDLTAMTDASTLLRAALYAENLLAMMVALPGQDSCMAAQTLNDAIAKDGDVRLAIMASALHVITGVTASTVFAKTLCDHETERQAYQAAQGQS